jgi:hypothetical protein
VEIDVGIVNFGLVDFEDGSSRLHPARAAQLKAKIQLKSRRIGKLVCAKDEDF